MNSHVAKSMIRSPLDFGWRESKCGLIPLFFEGPIASDFFTRSYFYVKRKIGLCKKLCMQQTTFVLSCTSVCLCERSDNCNNEIKQQTRFIYDDNFSTVYEEEDTDEDL